MRIDRFIIYRQLCRLARCSRGAASMEYVLIAVLIAAVVIFMVIAFSRGIFSTTTVNTYSVTLQHTRTQEALPLYRKDREKDITDARTNADSMSK